MICCTCLLMMYSSDPTDNSSSTKMDMEQRCYTIHDIINFVIAVKTVSHVATFPLATFA